MCLVIPIRLVEQWWCIILVAYLYNPWFFSPGYNIKDFEGETNKYSVISLLSECVCVHYSFWWVLLAYSEEAGELPRQLVDKALTDNVPSASQTSGKTDVPLKDAEPVNNLSDPVKTLPSSSKPKYRYWRLSVFNLSSQVTKFIFAISDRSVHYACS